MNILELTIGQAGLWSAFVDLMGDALNLIFRFLNHFGFGNAALCIVIFTVVIKTLMIPLNVKQQKFSKLSSKMQPELQAIQKKYQGKSRTDQEAMRAQSMEMNELYEKYGVTPTGGCLPLLITMPVIFALYRVIYNIPSHIDYIGNLYDAIADKIMNVSDYSDKLGTISEGMKRLTVEGDIDTKKEVVNVLSNLKVDQWNDLKELFPSCADIIATNSEKIIDINSFLFGLNIMDWPTTKPFPGLIIPVLALIIQWYQTRQITVNNNNSAADNPTAQSMMMMTKIMPFFSAFICLSLPIGVGIYWIVSGIFQIIQQYFVNRHMDKIDLDELIEKNREKARQKKIKMGVDPDASFAQIAQQNRKSMAGYANSGKISKNASKSNADNKGSDNNSNKNYKKGSIAAYANMMYDKEDNNK